LKARRGRRNKREKRRGRPETRAKYMGGGKVNDLLFCLFVKE